MTFLDQALAAAEATIAFDRVRKRIASLAPSPQRLAGHAS